MHDPILDCLVAARADLEDERSHADADRREQIDLELARLDAAAAAFTQPAPEWTRHVTDAEVVGAMLDRAPILPRQVAPPLGRGDCRPLGPPRPRR